MARPPAASSAFTPPASSPSWPTLAYSSRAGCVKHHQDLGRLVAQAGILPWDELIATYGPKLVAGLALLGRSRKHVNARSVQHLLGYLKKELSSEEKQELLALIEDHRQELGPLTVLLTLLQHHLRRHPVPDWVWDARGGCVSGRIRRSWC